VFLLRFGLACVSYAAGTPGGLFAGTPDDRDGREVMSGPPPHDHDRRRPRGHVWTAAPMPMTGDGRAVASGPPAHDDDRR
jgi:hypothetical protein